MPTRPYTLSAEEEEAVFALLTSSNLNAAFLTPTSKTLIKLLWALETRRVVGDVVGQG